MAADDFTNRAAAPDKTAIGSVRWNRRPMHIMCWGTTESFGRRPSAGALPFQAALIRDAGTGA
ncbi:hypothetical protein EOD23_12530 [Mesorhizobium sp. USDA-HM6]|nr:hypothetical protein EOD23_12530 [Mesorhizobium sp. USDA-HM6]